MLTVIDERSCPGRAARAPLLGALSRRICDGSTGTLQPPLPLQEFLPAHPSSPPLQPPWPLHAFLPAHSCLAFVAQPPLPLHEFLPAQPPSPDLQPPLPLHALWPLQTWFSPPPSSPAIATFAICAPATRPPATPSITFPKSRRFIAMSFPSLVMSRLVETSPTVSQQTEPLTEILRGQAKNGCIFCNATACRSSIRSQAT